MAEEIKRELQKRASKERAKNLQRFFKTGKGEYGEGDLFLGVVVPEIRKIAKRFAGLQLSELKKPIKSKFHEERLASLLILVEKFQKAKEPERKKIFGFYINNKKSINNWDLVDLTAPKIIGPYLEDKSKKILYKLAKSDSIWDKRISMLSCFYYICRKDCRDALKIAEILKKDKEDLIQKAVGWMLREVGKRCKKSAEEEFLHKNYRIMPRTMLRYAIEKFPQKERKHYLDKQ